MSVLPSCVLNRIQKPLKSVRNQKPGQIFAEVLGLIGAGRQPLQVGAVRDDRRREIDVEKHAEEAEQRPRPRADRRGRSASTRASGPRFSGVVGKHRADVRQLISWPPTALGIAPTFDAHAEALVAHPVGDRQVAEAAGAGRCRQRADQRPVDRLRSGRRS